MIDKRQLIMVWFIFLSIGLFAAVSNFVLNFHHWWHLLIAIGICYRLFFIDVKYIVYQIDKR